MMIVNWRVIKTRQAKSSTIVRSLRVGDVISAEQFLFFTRLCKNTNRRQDRVSFVSQKHNT